MAKTLWTPGILLVAALGMALLVGTILSRDADAAVCNICHESFTANTGGGAFGSGSSGGGGRPFDGGTRTPQPSTPEPIILDPPTSGYVYVCGPDENGDGWADCEYKRNGIKTVPRDGGTDGGT